MSRGLGDVYKRQVSAFSHPSIRRIASACVSPKAEMLSTSGRKPSTLIVLSYALTFLLPPDSGRQAPLYEDSHGFQCFPGSSAICCKSVENPQDFENAAFYQAAPENSDRRHCSCQALSLCKKARRKLKCMSLRLAFARTSCTPMTHCVPMG